jgi:tRNA-dihydrouridine synthase C
MEGLLDFVLRDILTRAGGVDRCVSEFIRVTNTVLPDRVYMRVVPEMLTGWRTFAGVPVRPQLLGSDPACLADNAAALARLSPPGIDLNFGCPAKVVNRHGGGAALLDEPELVAQIVSAVRRAVPPHIAVSAKMRLGFNDDSRAEECAIAIAESGANELVVHARTKADGYRPPAYWSRIADVRAVVNIPVVANGEIWNVADAQRCRDLSGCSMLMIGRGMVTDPSLARAIQGMQVMDATHASAAALSLDWHSLFLLIQDFWDLVGRRLDKKSRTGRLKQWLNFLRRSYPEAEAAYQALRIYNEPERVDAWLANEQLARQLQIVRP